MAPLQRRALYSLVIGIICTITLIVVFVTRDDITTFYKDQGFRLIVSALWIVVPLVYLIMVNLTLRKSEQIDERDRLILARAPKAQYVAVLVSLVAWTIGLTESFWEEGQVPVMYITLMMLSTLIIGTIGLCFGILIGYRRGVSRDEG